MRGAIVIIASIVLNILLVNSILAQCDIKNTVFKSGEEVTYNVYYKLSFMWFNAAHVSFSVKPDFYNNKKAFYFKSTGYTLPNYDWIFKVRDSFISIVDSATLRPLYFSRQTSEGSYWANDNYKFDYTNKQIYTTIENSKTKKFNDTLLLNQCVYDVLSAIYACRNLNIDGIKPNDTLPIVMVVDSTIYQLYLRFIATEIATLNNGDSYKCNKFAILMVAGTIFSGGEDITVWISDDKARIPIKVEAKILVGSIIAQVNTITNSLNQIKSLNNK